MRKTLKLKFIKEELAALTKEEVRAKLFAEGFSVKLPYSVFFDEDNNTVTYEQEIPDVK